MNYPTNRHSSGIAAADFLSVDKYTHACAWAQRIKERPAVVRGLQVCNWNGIAKPWLQPTLLTNEDK